MTFSWDLAWLSLWLLDFEMYMIYWDEGNCWMNLNMAAARSFILFHVVFGFLHHGLGLISDYKLCGDPECESKLIIYIQKERLDWNCDVCLPVHLIIIWLCAKYFNYVIHVQVIVMLSYLWVFLFFFSFLISSGMISRVQAQRDHTAKDCRFLNLKKGDMITVYYKLTGKRNDLWAGSVSLPFSGSVLD